jgi:hypothetical protein
MVVVRASRPWPDIDVAAQLAALAALVLGGCGRLAFDRVEGLGDARPAAPSAADGDDDGVADTVDNCPAVANPDQRNEDGDRFGDACDPCPPIADADPVVDSDGDGVSDACDPFPARPGDQIAVFDGFAAAPASADIAGTWSFSGGAAISSSSLDAVSAVTWTVADARRGTTVTALGTIDASFGDNVARPIGVVQQFHQASVVDGILCVFGLNPSNAEVFALADNARTDSFDFERTPAGTGAMSTFVLNRSGIMYRCNGSTSPRELMASTALMSAPNRIGVFTRSASAHFAWVMIVTSPP